jgi:hypothetical protein
MRRSLLDRNTWEKKEVACTRNPPRAEREAGHPGLVRRTAKCTHEIDE